jgi:membrane protein implicated in regulation of membrane protease activity
MYLVLIAWIYVAFMMAIAEATSPVGSLLGAAFTFLLYGVLPMSIVGYIMGAPARRRARKAKETASVAPNTNTETSCHPLTTERKEP